MKQGFETVNEHKVEIKVIEITEGIVKVIFTHKPSARSSGYTFYFDEMSEAEWNRIISEVRLGYFLSWQKSPQQKLRIRVGRTICWKETSTTFYNKPTQEQLDSFFNDYIQIHKEAINRERTRIREAISSYLDKIANFKTKLAALDNERVFTSYDLMEA